MRSWTVPLLTVASFMALLTASSAQGATVYVGQAGGSGAVAFEAAPGERNEVLVSVTTDDPSTGRPDWTFADAGARIVAGPGCVSRDEHTAVCRSAVFEGFGFEGVVRLGDGDDRFNAFSGLGARAVMSAEGGDGRDEMVSGLYFGNRLAGGAGDDVLRISSPFSVMTGMNDLDGGPGDDRLYGSDSGDLLNGGGGHDELHGGTGADHLQDGDRDDETGPDVLDGGPLGPHEEDNGDTVSYAHRSSPVRVDLAGAAAGEGDILTRVSNVVGGRGDDHISGDSTKNVLDGGGGADVLAGRGGDDWLTKAGGRVSCGTGDDRVVGGRDRGELLLQSCEWLARYEYDPLPLAAYPVREGRSLGYRLYCPWDDAEFQNHIIRCSAQVRLREAGGEHRLVATAHFPRRRWEGASARLRLTPRGDRLASRGRRTRLAVTVVGRGLPLTRWSIRLRLPTRR